MSFPRCGAEADGFCLHAGTALPAYDREGVEHLLCYMCRAPVALDRLEELPDGRLLYRLKKRWRDGTDSIVFEPLEFLKRLTTLVPAPRFNMIRYSGVPAPGRLDASLTEDHTRLRFKLDPRVVLKAT